MAKKEPRELTPDEQAARFATMAASVVMTIVWIDGLLAIFLAWWVGSSATGNLYRGVTHIGLDSSVTLWGYELIVRVPISPDSPDLHTVTINSQWSTWCVEEEVRIRAWPTACVTLNAARAFCILTPILAVGADVSMLLGLSEPLALLAGAFLSFLAGISAAVGAVCGVLTASVGIMGIGFILLVVNAVLAMGCMCVSLYAASKAMPLEEPTGVAGVLKRSDSSRLKRSQSAREDELARSQEMDEYVRKYTSERSAGGDTREYVPKSYSHMRRVVEWAQANNSDANAEIPLDMLEAAFQEMDSNTSGSIDIDELLLAFRGCGMPASGAATRTLLKEIDKNQSNEVDIQEFVEFFRSVEELNRFQHRAEQRAQLLTIACSCCFLFFLVVVGALLLIFIQMDEAEAGSQNYSIMRNVLYVCCVVLGLLFISVILIPALRLTLGANAVAWHRHYERRFTKVKKRRPGGDGARYECRFRCGYKGGMQEVQAHEKVCQARGNRPVPKGGLRQASWAAGGDQPTTVNAAIFGASYRVKKAQAELAKMNRDWRECSNGCGFSGTNDEVTHHEYMCPLRGRANMMASEHSDLENACPPPGVLLNEDGVMDRYDPLAFRMEQMNQLAQRQTSAFVTVTSRDTGQHLQSPLERAAANSGGFLALTNGNAGR